MSARKMSLKQAKEQIASVIGAYESVDKNSVDCDSGVYRKVWLSARDIEAMAMALELFEKGDV